MSEELREETISTNYLYRGRIVNVRQDKVLIPGGLTAFREVVEHPGAVAVLALDDQGRLVMVRQHRQAAGEVLLEIPAGKLEAGEEPQHCAERELMEETGLEADKWHEICHFYPSPGFCDEIIYLFRAEGLRSNPSASTDPDEIVITERIQPHSARQMIADGQIRDGKTIIAVQNALLGNE